MLETRTRLKGAMPASRSAFSKLTSFSRCCPLPRTRKTLLGRIAPISLLRLDGRGFFEVDLPGDVINAEKDGLRPLGDGEEADEGRLPGWVVADAGHVLAVDAEVALEDDRITRLSGLDGPA